MDLTESYVATFDETLRDRYAFSETRNAAAILAATNPARFDDLVLALDESS